MVPDDYDHRTLALWTADCAEHVLRHFEEMHPGDARPRKAIQAARSWARCQISVDEARAAAFAAHAAARETSKKSAGSAACAAGHAASTAYVANFARLAANHAVCTAHFAGLPDPKRHERAWQRQRLPEHLRQLMFGT